MAIMLNAIIRMDDAGEIRWQVGTGTKAESLGITPINTGGVVRTGMADTVESLWVEDFFTAVECVAARLGRLAQQHSATAPLWTDQRGAGPTAI